MNREGYTYEVSVGLVLTMAEVVHLMLLSQHHYDGYCRSISQPGGFLYGWSNRFDPQGGPDPGETRVQANFDQLDTLCKICEIDHRSQTPNPQLAKQISEALRALGAESKRANGWSPETLVLFVFPPGGELAYDERVTVTFEQGAWRPRAIPVDLQDEVRARVSSLYPGCEVRTEAEYMAALAARTT